MLRNIAVLVGTLIVLGVISAVLTYARAGNMSPLADIQSKGLAVVQQGNLVFFGVVVPLVVGIVAFFVYRGMVARSPATANTSFLLLSIGIGIVFTVLAAIVFKMRGFAELTALHVLYVAGLGWVMPMLWAV